MSKNAASALLRRLLAVRITKSLIQMVNVRQTGLPAEEQVPKYFGCTNYEHHIEPKLERFSIGDSPWMAYLQGYDYEASR